MYKKICLLILTLLSAVSLFAQEEPLEWRKNITLIAVPREPQAIQVAQDISRRYPILLVCYQQAGDTTTLFAWDGEAWVSVTTEDYINGAFFKIRPQHAIIVENENKPAPDILVPDGTWCDSGNRLTSTDRRVMTHLLGLYFDFPYRYWMQFAKRYNYAVEEINPGLENIFWWHYRGDEIKPAFDARDKEADMDKWLFLDIAQPEPIEQVAIKEEPETIPPAEIPAEEPVEESIEEPAETDMPPLAEEPAAEVKEELPAKETPDTTSTNEMEKVEKALKELTAETPAEANPFTDEEIPAAEVLPAAK